MYQLLVALVLYVVTLWYPGRDFDCANDYASALSIYRYPITITCELISLPLED